MSKKSKLSMQIQVSKSDKPTANMGFAKVGLKNRFWALGNSIELLYIGRIK